MSVNIQGELPRIVDFINYMELANVNPASIDDINSPAGQILSSRAFFGVEDRVHPAILSARSSSNFRDTNLTVPANVKDAFEAPIVQVASSLDATINQLAGTALGMVRAVRMLDLKYRFHCAPEVIAAKAIRKTMPMTPEFVLAVSEDKNRFWSFSLPAIDIANLPNNPIATTKANLEFIRARIKDIFDVFDNTESGSVGTFDKYR